MNKILVYTFFFLCGGRLVGQDISLRLSLQEALALGLKNRIELKNQELNLQLAENEINKVKARNFPQLNAAFDERINTQLQTQVLSPQALGGLSTEPIKAKFGTKYYNVFAVNGTQNIFNPAIRGDKQIGFARKELESANFEKLKIDIKFSISEAYYDALLKRERTALSLYNLNQSHEFYKRGVEQFKNGTILQTTLDRLELDEMNAVNSKENDEHSYRLSLTNLVNQLGLPLGSVIELAEPIDVTIEPEEAANIVVQAGSRVEVRQEQLQMLVNTLNLKKQIMGYLPVVSLYGNYTLQQFNNKYDPTNGGLWNPYNYFGLRIELPLFDGFAKERSKQEFKYRLEQNKNNLIKLEYDMAYELQTAALELGNATNRYYYSKRNYELAKKVLDADQVRLREGTITEAELVSVSFSLKSAQINYLESLYNYFISRIRLTRAEGGL
jgi:outer membrane protein